MIIIIATIKVKPGRKQEFVESACSAIEETRKEAGNISYSLFSSVQEENTVVFLEEWKDQESLSAHIKAPHFKALGSLIKDMSSEAPVLKKYQASEF